MKPKLSINKLGISNPFSTLGMTELINYLINSDLFEIDYHEEQPNAMRKERATLVKFNGRNVYIDFWEYQAPAFTNEIYNQNYDLIIKLQIRKFYGNDLENACKRKGVLQNITKEQREEYAKKIVPWTFFPSKQMKQFIGKEDSIPKLPAESFGFFCGKTWKSRMVMRDKFIKEGVEYISSDQAFRSVQPDRIERSELKNLSKEEIAKACRPLTDEEYLRKMQTSKFGIVLPGRGSFFSEAKNRREIDYMMLKKPLLLSYKPYYYDELIERKHYIYMNEKTDLKNLENQYNIEEIGMNGYEWYKRNASPKGCAESFLRIMQEKL